MMQDYKNGWRYIVWVGGNDDYYKTFSRDKMYYQYWFHIGYDDLVITEIQKDGTEKIIYNSQENE